MKRDAKRVSVTSITTTYCCRASSSRLVLSVEARSSRPPSRNPLHLPTSFSTSTFSTRTFSTHLYDPGSCFGLPIIVAPTLFSALASRLHKSRSSSPQPADASPSASAMGQTPSKKSSRKGKDKSNGKDTDDNDGTNDGAPSKPAVLSPPSEVEQFLNAGKQARAAASNGSSQNRAFFSNR